MPTAALLAQILNETSAALAARLDALLVGYGPIGLQELLVTRRSYAPGPTYTISLVYTTPGPLQLRAMAFTGTPALAADAQANTFLATNPTYRVHMIRDIGDQRRGRLSDDVALLVYATSSTPNCGYDRSKMVIVSSTQIIASGASGTARIHTGSGLGAAITMLNASSISWANGVYGYAFPQAGACTYLGIPTCCGP